jgi:hypothetical protein
MDQRLAYLYFLLPLFSSALLHTGIQFPFGVCPLILFPHFSKFNQTSTEYKIGKDVKKDAWID